MASDEVNDRIKQQKQKKVITESDGPISLLWRFKYVEILGNRR